jgi:hypothetical protein
MPPTSEQKVTDEGNAFLQQSVPIYQTTWCYCQKFKKPSLVTLPKGSQMKFEDQDEQFHTPLLHSCADLNPFLGALAKLQKATISFAMSFRPLSVCLSVCPHGTTPLILDGF